MPWSADQALQHWQNEGLLTDKKAAELRRNLDASEHEVPSRALTIFSAIGAILIGLGVILFIASNWSEMSTVLKTAILLIGLITTAVAGYYLAFERRDFDKTGRALLLSNALLFGASIFLVAQIYHLPLNFWVGGLLWFAGTALFAYILQSRVHLWLSVPLLILFLGWLRTSILTGTSLEFDFLTDHRSTIIRLFPVIGLSILSLSFVHRERKHLDFAANTLFNWGLFITLFSVVLSTVEKGFFYEFFSYQSDLMANSITVVAAALVALAVAAGVFQTKDGKKGLVALALYVVFVYLLANVPAWMGIEPQYFLNREIPFIVTGFFIIHILLVFVALLTVLWYGTLLRNAAVINMGMAGIALLILIQYVSYGFTMRDRSLFFIVGGILLIALSTILERKRRDLLSRYTQS